MSSVAPGLVLDDAAKARLAKFHEDGLTANVPPGFERGWGDDAVSFAEHWEPQTVTKSADFPITEERPRDVGAPGAAT